MQCGPDEPSWTWTQIWVQAHMPDYSLNWTARSSAIQKWQRCQCCRWPSRSREHWLSGTDARQSAEKLLHKAAADHTSSKQRSANYQDRTVLQRSPHVSYFLPAVHLHEKGVKLPVCFRYDGLLSTLQNLAPLNPDEHIYVRNIYNNS